MPSAKQRAIYKAAGRCCSCGATLPKTKEPRTKCNDCRKDATAYRHIYKRNHKKRAVEMFGHKCKDCKLVTNYLAVYEFHHLGDKAAHISKLLNGASWENLLLELKKCVMLCANCHRIRHAKERKASAALKKAV